MAVKLADIKQITPRDCKLVESTNGISSGFFFLHKRIKKEI